VDDLDILRRAYPFQDSTRAEVEALLPSFRRHSFAPEQFVWQAGDPADHLWFVIKGQIRNVITSADGGEMITQVAGPGESFGQPALFLPGRSRIGTCIATGPTELLSLGRDVLLRFLQTNPAALRRMLESMSLLIFDAGGMLREISFRDVRGRVVYQLLKFAEEYGEPVPDGVRISLKLSQTTLAGLMASSRESVNRVLAALVASGHIRQDGGYIVLTRADDLRHVLAAAE
jgi:CRP-like cAMP-binding protein